VSPRRALAVAASVLLLLVACRVEEPPASKGPAPEWTLSDLDGRPVTLAELRGKPVVIDFWATWCPPCEFQIPILNRVHEHYGGRVEVVGIAVDVGGREVVAPFAAEHKIGYRVLLGDEDLAQRYGALGFPSLFVVGPDGTIASSHVGVVEPDELQRAVDATLPATASRPTEPAS
jgi:thiol-disulfide isomerase/thioredoxin